MREFLKVYWNAILIALACIALGYLISESISPYSARILLKISLPFPIFILAIIAIDFGMGDNKGRKKEANNSLKRIGRFFNYLYVYSIAFPLGLVFLKLFFPSDKDECEACGKRRRGSVIEYPQPTGHIFICFKCQENQVTMEMEALMDRTMVRIK